MEKKNRTIPSGYKNRIMFLKEAYDSSDDFIVHEITVGDVPLAFAYFKSLSAADKLFYYIIPALVNFQGDPVQFFQSLHTDETDLEEEITSSLIDGKVTVIIDSEEKLYTLPLVSIFKRNPEEPNNELIVRGSHYGFIEDLQSNLLLIRQRIESPDLSVKILQLGKQSHTKTAIIFMKNLADDEVVHELQRRLSYIDSDFLISPGFIEEFIEDNPWSLFPQMLNTERPDRVMGNLMEGRIALLSEGSPTALIVPTTFFSFYQSPDDYNSRWVPATFIRLLRLTSFIIAISLPAIYIGVVAFHLEVIPHELLLPMKNSVEGIPYPPLLEALIMELTLELIREAGIRLPNPISQTIGIVGGLVIGDAVVQAGLISDLMIVVVATTAIASFVVPSVEMSTTVRILRFPLMALAATFGFIGIMFGFIFILIGLTKLSSFGTPYFSPFAPLRIKDWKDTFIRLPIWMLKKRPLDARAKQSRQLKKSRGWEHSD
ncbi:spore germination protein [Bacillus lacus]|uniref:Spore germination protein n=1 Tax=Metabacillus lacus TaxID=1983721 RepID=A0A7X2IZ31_9BACI|nr:spore germination protein [Metabacillus lacus]MRX72279.1 spore germination protein [Metabacillus lacus]